MMKSYFSMFALYNQWANQRLYAAASTIPDDAYRSDRGAFFGSLHGTLNHILVADHIWMRRFTGEGPMPTKLDEILHDTFDDLAVTRRREDERIIAFADNLNEDRIGGTFTYRTLVDPRDITQPLAPALAHFFNHQTHHRGQAHCLVTELAGRDAMPSLDLLMFQRETGIGLS